MTFTFTDKDMEDNGNGQHPDQVDPGSYVAKVSAVKVGNKPTTLMITFTDSETGDFLCNDFIHFTPKAKWIACKKLKIIGLEKDENGVYDAMSGDLKGMKVVLNLVKADDNKYLSPDFDDDGFGYKTFDEAFAEETVTDDVPF